jgi:predicted Rossmann fold flavoprotein
MSENQQPPSDDEAADVAVIGAGAAGFMAAIFAGRAGARVTLLDSASRIGAKILISGGGRCNVTHDVVTAVDFNGNRNAIARVLRTFDVEATVGFFAELGVPLKREEGGKLFPVSNRARDVIDALLGATQAAGVTIVSGEKVTRLAVLNGSERAFLINDHLRAKNVILATGGRSVPKTGSDGSGYALVRTLGHTVTDVFPALVPLVLESGHWLTALSGSSVEAELLIKGPGGRVLQRASGSMLFTHFGLSGPVVLDISRHWIAAQPAALHANLLPGETFESLERTLIDEARRNPTMTIANLLRRHGIPDRLATALAPGATPLVRVTKEERRAVVRSLVDLPLPVTRDRGFEYAEVTAGGVPLSEVDVRTMASRVCEGLFLCGEILDVDGKIGGYNFQWAWASGRLAGVSAGESSGRVKGEE